MSITRHYTRHAEGSVLVCFGDTKVLCTASVEEKVPPHKRGSGEGWVTAEYGMLPRATTPAATARPPGKQSGRTQEIQRLIGRSLRSVFDLKALGERTIRSIATCCRPTAARAPPRSPALSWRRTTRVSWLLAGKKIAASPIRSFVAAVSVGIVEGTPLLDLEYVEDSACDTDMNVVMTSGAATSRCRARPRAPPFTHAEMARLLAWPTRASANGGGAAGGARRLSRCAWCWPPTTPRSSPS